jgi:hypothetical protein
MATRNGKHREGSGALDQQGKNLHGVAKEALGIVDDLVEENPEITVTVDEGYKISVDASDKASEINRQLAFAGIAIIWVFKIDAGGGRQIVPYELFLPGLLLVIGLGLDLLHYVLKSEIWYRITRKHEKADSLNFPVAPWVNYPGDILYWLKILATVSAYVLLVRFLVRQLF